jgi:hypothetical protein
MLGRIRAHLTYANVMVTLLAFVVLGGGTAWAIDEWTGANIQDGTLTTLDYKNNNIGSADVRNGNLNDEDIAQGAFVNFTANIGLIAAHECSELPITGVNATGDHLLLTPNWNDTVSPHLDYDVLYRNDHEMAVLKVCNDSAGDIQDGNTRFNLLVIDAQ